MTPTAQISAFFPEKLLTSGSHTSGGIKWNVPSVFVSVSSSFGARTLLTPKSAITGSPCRRSTFCGLMSLWSTPILCNYRSPSQILLIQCLIIDSFNSCDELNSSCLGCHVRICPPSQKSRTSISFSSDSNTSCSRHTLLMFGC